MQEPSAHLSFGKAVAMGLLQHPVVISALRQEESSSEERREKSCALVVEVELHGKNYELAFEAERHETNYALGAEVGRREKNYGTEPSLAVGVERTADGFQSAADL